MLAVLFLDLDRFKMINDTLGHTIGNSLLVAVSRRLRGSVREDDTVARMGGDEFIFILRGLRSSEDAVKPAQKILAAIRPPFHLQGHELHVTASIGVSLYPSDGVGVRAAAAQCADVALYRAKDARPQSPAAVQPDHERPHRRADGARAPPAPGDRAAAVRPGLSAAGRSRHEPGRRRRGVAALASSRARPGAARAVRAARRGYRADPSAGPVGAVDRVPAASGMVRGRPASPAHGGEHVGAPVSAARAGPARARASGRDRHGAWLPRPRDHRGRADAGRRLHGRHARQPGGHRASAWRSTISAPATRRSAICGAFRSSASRSMARRSATSASATAMPRSPER